MASGGCAPASTSGSAGGGIAGTKTVSASLWWDSFVALSDDLDRAAASPSAAISDALAERIKGHHAWLRGSVSMFGKPNDASRTALDVSQVAVGEHRLAVKHDLKEAALHVSKSLKLDEVQSYILVKRSSESTPTTHDADTEEFLRLVCSLSLISIRSQKMFLFVISRSLVLAVRDNLSVVHYAVW
uniref:Uncharacterized protein n=1 Tax=Avena sativa TaxID=4498 RepID=A0ACD5U5S3_AVESA